MADGATCKGDLPERQDCLQVRVSGGERLDSYALPGTQIDRFGRSTGGFVGPAGTPFGDRALPTALYDAEYRVYEVKKPIDGVRG